MLNGIQLQSMHTHTYLKELLLEIIYLFVMKPLKAKIPALYGVPLLTKDFSQFSIVVFSHSCIGCCTCCSGICSDLASHGFVVVVPEHGDGSSSVSLRRTSFESPSGYVDECFPYCEKKERESEFKF